jgi:hypothetical protein
VVWHHRRSCSRAYLRQQRFYGHSEALIEARHPERFTVLGTARWLGTIYTSSRPRGGSQRIYRGTFGTSPFQSIYRRQSHGADIANQLGVPTAVMLLLTAPLGALFLVLLLPALAGLTALAALFALNATRAQPGAVPDIGRLRARATIAALTMAQPLVRAWGHTRNRAPALRNCAAVEVLRAPTGRAAGRVFIYDADGDRSTLANALIGHMRRGGLRIVPATGWEDHDARFAAGPFVWGEILASAYPADCIQVRVRRRPRWRSLAAAAVVAAAAGSISLGALTAVAVLVAVGALWGAWRTGPYVSRLLAGRAS